MKLYDILKEIQGRPKAIILAGAPGAGKGYILRGLDLGGLKILNVDDIYVPMLKKANMIALDLLCISFRISYSFTVKYLL